MAVYTDISGTDFEAVLAEYDIGRFVSAKGIAEGVENSNYLLLTDQSPFIATAYEKRMNPAELPFFMALKTHLSTAGVPCPKPIADKQGDVVRMVNGRPFAIVEFLQGSSPRKILPEHCAALGTQLAQMHVASGAADLSRDNTLGAKQLAGYYAEMASDVAVSEYAAATTLIDHALDVIARDWPRDLPRGVIHADLFPDNVLFQGTAITGLIDFYFACTDFYAYDLAICLNAWCFEGKGELNITKARRFLHAYDAVRPLSDAEWQALPVLAQGAALRFLLTRLHDALLPDDGALVSHHDPAEYVDKLRFHEQVKSYHEYGV